MSGSSATMDFELIAAGDPYFANIDPAQNNQPYLSQDLRVFRAAPAINNVPFPGGPTFGADSVAGAYSYIQALLGHLNGTPAFTNPVRHRPVLAAARPGRRGPDRHLGGAVRAEPGLPADIRQQLQLRHRARAAARLVGPGRRRKRRAGVLPRVRQPEPGHRLRPERDLRVARRTRPAQPGTPLPGAGDTTVPFFATGNAGSETDYQTRAGRTSRRSPSPTARTTSGWYYGCFLNFYDPANHDRRPAGAGAAARARTTASSRRSPTTTRRSPHGVSPMSWDQLAQRNLQFTVVDNPGPGRRRTARRRPSTLRPSRAIGKPRGNGLPPDELMIDWGNVPAWIDCVDLLARRSPAADVIALARTWGGATGLSIERRPHPDADRRGRGHATCPIPTGTGQNFAGLLTLELPVGIRTGQEFEVLVRRISTRFGKPAPPPPPPS